MSAKNIITTHVCEKYQKYLCLLLAIRIQNPLFFFTNKFQIHHPLHSKISKLIPYLLLSKVLNRITSNKYCIEQNYLALRKFTYPLINHIYVAPARSMFYSCLPYMVTTAHDVYIILKQRWKFNADNISYHVTNLMRSSSSSSSTSISSKVMIAGESVSTLQLPPPTVY